MRVVIYNISSKVVGLCCYLLLVYTHYDLVRLVLVLTRCLTQTI